MKKTTTREHPMMGLNAVERDGKADIFCATHEWGQRRKFFSGTFVLMCKNCGLRYDSARPVCMTHEWKKPFFSSGMSEICTLCNVRADEIENGALKRNFDFYQKRLNLLVVAIGDGQEPDADMLETIRGGLLSMFKGIQYRLNMKKAEKQ